MEESMKRKAETAPDPRAVWLYSDGVYRWAYERDLYKNRYETNYILKIVLLVFALTWAAILGMLLVLIGGVGGGMVVAITSGICLGGWLLTAAIVLLVQRLSAGSRGGVDVVRFEMGEQGLRQIRSGASERADRAMETVTAVSGLASGNAYAALNSREIVSGTHLDIVSYADVRSIKVCPKYDVIDVTLKGNYKCRVYARGKDLDFVKNYIVFRASGRIRVKEGNGKARRAGQ